MCTVLLPPGDNPIAVNKYIISQSIVQNQISNNILVPMHYSMKEYRGCGVKPHAFLTFTLGDIHLQSLVTSSRNSSVCQEPIWKRLQRENSGPCQESSPAVVQNMINHRNDQVRSCEFNITAYTTYILSTANSDIMQ